MTNKHLQIALRGKHKEVAVVRMAGAARRNALNDALIAPLRQLFEEMPAGVRAAVFTLTLVRCPPRARMRHWRRSGRRAACPHVAGSPTPPSGLLHSAPCHHSRCARSR